MLIALIRHGQTAWNAEGRMQGSTDVPLNDVGREQAREAVSLLTSSPWHAVVSSPLVRARETAAIIAEGLSVPLGPGYDLLVERRYGDGEGLTMEEIEARWPDRSIPGLEPIASVTERGVAALDRIAREFDDRDLVVVCHGTLIRHTLGAVAGRRIGPILNGSVSSVERSGDGWIVRTVNGEQYDEHAEPAPAWRF